MKLEVNRESADALYKLAEGLPKALRSLAEDTSRLLAVYESVRDSVGPHSENFLEMAKCISTALKDVDDTSQMLYKVFWACADRIMECIDDVPPELKLTLKPR